MSLTAYKTAQSASEDPRAREYRLFINITSLLERVKDVETVTPELAGAIHDNRCLWGTLVDDLSHEENQLPNELKAQLISLGIWVSRHSQEVLNGRASIDALIDVNRSIIKGLSTSLQQGQKPGAVAVGAQA